MSGQAWERHDAGEVVVDGLNFPEGAYWSARDGCLYFVEWAGDKVWRLREGKPEVFFTAQPGDGPCGLGRDREGNLWVTLYSSGRVAQLSLSGRVLRLIDGYQGEPFKGPNQLIIDARGGVYFTDSGHFEDDWTTGRPAGSIYYLSPAGDLIQVDAGLCFSNGIALSPDGTRLLVNEHRKNRVLQYDINPDGMLSGRRVLAELDDNCLLPADHAYELGPDGMCRDEAGLLWVAHYGGGKVIALSLEGAVLGRIHLARGRKPTNVALDERARALYVTESETGVLYRIDLTQGPDTERS